MRPRSRSARARERRARAKHFDARAAQLAQLYRLMSRLELAARGRRAATKHCTAHASTYDERCAAASARGRSDCSRADGRVVRRRLVLLCDIPGRWSRTHAHTSSSWQRPRGRAERGGVRVATRLTRDRALASRTRDGAQRAAEAAPDWSKWHADRRRPEGVQRSARPPQDGTRRRHGDPLDGWERGTRHSSAGRWHAARLAHRIVGEPRVSAAGFVRSGGWSPRSSTATHSSADIASRRSARSWTSGGDLESAGEPRPARRGRAVAERDAGSR
jgi:hypothetical protein